MVQHAICNVLEPLFEKTFIFDSYACRKRKGTHRAIRRVQRFLRRRGFFFKADIEQFFASIDHAVLKKLLRRRIKDEKVLTLMDLIIDHPVPGYRPGKGVGIGNLTSQWWANFYLDCMDHYIKDGLGIKCYVRYMDDFVVLADDKGQLHEWRYAIEKFIGRQLRLSLKEKACFVAPAGQGIPFLGFNIYPNLIRLRHGNLIRFSRRVRHKAQQPQAGALNEDTLIRSVASMIGHIKHANTFQLRKKMFTAEGQ